MKNAVRLGAVPFGVGAVTVRTNVMKASERTELCIRLEESSSWIYGDLHSSWFGVILHFDDDFLHRFRYNSVERLAIYPAGRTQLFECVCKGFTSFHGQRVVWQARIAIRNDCETNNLDSPFHPCGRGSVDHHVHRLFFFFFWNLPQNLCGWGTSNKEFNLCGLTNSCGLFAHNLSWQWIW